MELLLGGPRLRLGRDEWLRINHGAGTRVSVREGLAWITQPGDPTDHFIAAGEEFTVASEGAAYVQAWEPSQIEVSTTRRRGLPGVLLGWLGQF